MSTSVMSASSSSKTRPILVRLFRYDSVATLREAAWGTLFATPWLLGLLFFVLGPILVSMYLSFTKYDVISSPTWIGLDNYIRAFVGDDLFWPSFGRTFRYALAVVPLGITGSLLLAMLLNQGLVGTSVFRTLYFLPHLTPGVAMALLWVWLLHPTIGPINYALGLLGIEGPGWFSSTEWAIPATILVSLWANLGGNQMIVFLAGLQGVPQELYDAAEVDGAGRWRKLVHVTLPMISPTLFFNLIMGVIGSLKVFTVAFVATQGGPHWATWFYALHLFRVSFQYFEMGYGAALAWIFAAVLILLTLVQFRVSQKWVYYAGEGI
jgi:multiple sugar transport system permease protein